MKKILCLDFSGDVLRCAEAGLSGKSPRILSGFSISGAAIQNDEKTDRVFIGSFRNNMKRHSMKSKNAVVFLHSPAILYREIQIPLIKSKDILSFLRLNANDYFPISVDTGILDVSLIEKNSEGLKLAVYLVNSELITGYRNFVKALGISTVSFAFSCPVASKDENDTFLSASVFDNEIFIQRYENGKIMYFRRESVSEGNYSVAFARAENYIRNISSANIYNEKIYIFGNTENRTKCIENISVLFGENIVYTGTNGKISEEYGDLAMLPCFAREAKTDYLEPFTEEKSGTIKKSNILTLSVIILLLSVIISPVVFKIMPENRLKEKKEYLNNITSDAILFDLYREYKKTIGKGKTGISLDTYNNHFSEFISELQEKLPATCTIQKVNVSEKYSVVTFTAPTKDDIATTINSFDKLTLSSAGDITEVKNTADGYTFSVKLTYSDGSNSGSKHNHKH